MKKIAALICLLSISFTAKAGIFCAADAWKATSEQWESLAKTCESTQKVLKETAQINEENKQHCYNIGVLKGLNQGRLETVKQLKRTAELDQYIIKTEAILKKLEASSANCQIK